jgi:benzil reductase ((S)-benzoin forming)
VLNISSGLGRRAMAGSAVYCAVKAGMDHLAVRWRWKKPHGRTAHASSRWRRASSTPTCRCSCAAPTRRRSRTRRFQKLQGRRPARQPRERGAAKVLAYLDRADFGRNPVGDVSDPA